MEFFFLYLMMEKHDIIVLPAVLVTVTYNCKNVIAPECEELLQRVEMLLIIKAKQMDGQSFSLVCTSVSLPCKPGTVCLRNKINMPTDPALKQGR